MSDFSLTQKELIASRNLNIARDFCNKHINKKEKCVIL